MQPIIFGKGPGESFGNRYQIERQLGKQAGRYTLLARDLYTQNQVVIKRLSFGEEFSWDQLKLFEREAATLKSLSHPAIPHYLDYFELNLSSGHGYALVQTYIPAESLDTHLKAGRTFSEADVIEIATAQLEILRYLHERSPAVIHRDIKPSNILLGDRTGNSIGTVYLVDFGAVQTLVAREGGSLTVVGTYGYMPPEQFGDRTVPASDLYSLGATLICLLTGNHPADLPQVDQRIDFESATHLSPTLTRWLKRMVAPSLNQRFTSAQEALKALDQRSVQTALKCKKPLGSKIRLIQDANTLEILIPPIGSSMGGLSGLAFLGTFAIAWNAFLVMWCSTSIMIPFPINVVFLLFSLPFWSVGIAMLGGIVFGLFGEVRLRLSSEQISQHYELFGLRRAVTPNSEHHEISRLEVTKTSYTKDSDGNTVEVKPELLIWAGTRRYGFFGAGTLSPPELNWLAQELSNWLDLPIISKS